MNSASSLNPLPASRFTVFERKNNYEPPVLVLVAAFLCSLYLLCPNGADPDLWGHVRYGQDALADGTIHRTTTYSYLAAGHNWVNHESLAEWTMGWIGPRWGGSGLMIMKLLLATYTLSLLHLIIRRRTLDSLASCILLLGGAWAMRYYWGTRPQLFSFASFATLLFVLDQAYASWFNYRSSSSPDTHETRPWSVAWLWLGLCPIVVGVWVNAHGGFIVGVAVLTLLLVARVAQQSIVSRTFASRHFVLAMLTILLCGLATLLTPYGTELLQWISGSLGKARPEILEWAAWDLSTAGQRLLWFCGLMTAAIVVSKKPKDWAEIAVVAVLAWQSAKHMRHSPFLVMALIAWGAPHVRSSCRSLQSTIGDWYRRTVTNAATESDKAESSPANTSDIKSLEGLPTHRWVRSSRLVNGISLAICLWFASLIWVQCSYIRVDHSQFPVDAFRFLKHHQIGGRTMISFNWAQYAIDALCEPLDLCEPMDQSTTPTSIETTDLPKASNVSLKQNHLEQQDRTNRQRLKRPTSIAVDGRFRTAYSQNLIDWHFDFLIGDSKPRVRIESSGPVDPGKMLTLGDPELIILERRNQVSCETVREASDDWTMLYQDSIAEIWGRKSLFDSPESDQFLPTSHRVITDQPAPYWSAWPAK